MSASEATANDKTVNATLLELVEAEPVLLQVVAQDSMTATTKYHAAKLARLVAAETRHFHTERERLFTALGVARDARTPAERAQFGPTVREIPADKAAEFQRQFKELADVPVTIAWAPLRSVDLPSATAAQYLDLGPLCELVDPDAKD